jgi:hypothetical protein
VQPLDEDAAELAQLLGTNRKSVYGSTAPRKAALRESLTSSRLRASVTVSSASTTSAAAAAAAAATASASGSKQRGSASVRPSTSESKR